MGDARLFSFPNTSSFSEIESAELLILLLTSLINDAFSSKDRFFFIAALVFSLPTLLNPEVPICAALPAPITPPSSINPTLILTVPLSADESATKYTPTESGMP